MHDIGFLLVKHHHKLVMMLAGSLYPLPISFGDNPTAFWCFP